MDKGTPSKELKERNEALYADWKSKAFTLVDLVKKYEISPQRIYKILEKFREQNKN